jgi:transcriptional regulator with XRE-family HTH domain
MIDSDWFAQKLHSKKLSQRKVAELLGVHYSRISRLLTGKLKMQISEARTLARILGASEEEVLRHADTRPLGAGPSVQEAKLRGQTAKAKGGLSSGLADDRRSYRAAEVSPAERKTGKRTHPVHPAFGSMKGLITLAPGVDLTRPAADPKSWKFRG